MGVRDHIGRPAHPLEVTVVGGVDRVLVSDVVRSLQASLQGPVEVVVDAMPAEDVPPGLRGRVVDACSSQTQCACCLLRSRLWPVLAGIAISGRHRHAVLVPSRGTAPRTVVEAFAPRDGERFNLGSIGRLRQVVTVIDAGQWAAELVLGQRLGDRLGPACPTAHLPVAEFAAGQVEVADVVVVGGAPDVRVKAAARVRGLNQRAARVDHDDDVADVILRGPGFRRGATDRPTWLRVLDGTYGDDHWWRWSSNRRFDARRLHKMLDTAWPTLQRSKGWIGVTGAEDQALAWSQAGPLLTLTADPGVRLDGPHPGRPFEPAGMRAARAVRPQRLALRGGQRSRIQDLLDSCLT